LADCALEHAPKAIAADPKAVDRKNERRETLHTRFPTSGFEIFKTGDAQKYQRRTTDRLRPTSGDDGSCSIFARFWQSTD
jgi:hypothetical protein